MECSQKLAGTLLEERRLEQVPELLLREGESPRTLQVQEHRDFAHRHFLCVRGEQSSWMEEVARGVSGAAAWLLSVVESPPQSKSASAKG